MPSTMSKVSCEERLQLKQSSLAGNSVGAKYVENDK